MLHVNPFIARKAVAKMDSAMKPKANVRSFLSPRVFFFRFPTTIKNLKQARVGLDILAMHVMSRYASMIAVVTYVFSILRTQTLVRTINTTLETKFFYLRTQTLTRTLEQTGRMRFK